METMMLNRSHIIYSAIWCIAWTGSANTTYIPYQAINHTCIKHTADNLVTHVADTANKPLPTITWNTDTGYPYPDPETYQIILPQTAFAYHFLCHEIPRCAAALMYDDSELTQYVPQRLRIYNTITYQQRNDTHDIAYNQYAINNNEYPAFTAVAFDFWQAHHGYSPVCQQLRESYCKRSTVLDNHDIYNKIWNVHEQIDNMFHDNTIDT